MLLLMLVDVYLCWVLKNGFSDDDSTMVFDIDGGGGWYGGWRG